MNYEIIEKLNGFNHVLFEENRHVYMIGDRKLSSVTALIKKFESDKDWNQIAYSYGMGGMIDQIFWNTKMQELQIWDWKTNKKIAASNKYNSFKSPISHVEECEYNKFSLQLSAYKHIIEKNLGLVIGSCYIVHFNTNNEKYKIMKTRDFEKEVKLMLAS